jgi:1-acyl-sn-glycerol-3-phosphate acyltransferase
MKFLGSVAYLAALTSFGVILSCLVFPHILLVVFWCRLRGIPRNRSATLVTERLTVWTDRIFRVVCFLMRIRLVLVKPEVDLFPSSIVLFNHQSTMDVIVKLAVTRRLGLMNFRWVVKAAIAGFPIMGWLSRAAQSIYVDRTGNPGDRDRVTEGALAAGSECASILLFPEGTRFTGPEPGSPYRHLRQPKPGGFNRLRKALPHYPVVSATIRWDPPIVDPSRAKTIFQAATYFGKTVYVDVIFVPVQVLDQDPDWLTHEWDRKEAWLSKPL